ncbi:MAG: nucleotide sugar dehydrogenase, partial [Thermodesulfobacteriota bacterium]|nr:nucleotide sugar dehydrogenase [Thermodesulfobacteriota bacterium]
DPLADAEEANKYYGVELKEMDRLAGVDAVILAVSHKAYKEIGFSGVAGLCRNKIPIVVDLKGVFSYGEAEKMNVRYWRL